MRDLHALPKIRDSLSFLYIEHARIEQDDQAIAVLRVDGKVLVPCAALTVLLLGPGTTVTHAAIRNLADAGCLVLWTGEGGVRMYAQGLGETRSARHLLHQATMWADTAQRERVVRRLYELRFREPLEPGLSLEQVRGREGARVRQAYAEASRFTGIPWEGRHYDRGSWTAADSVNRAVSAANSCLYGICHSAILSAGFCPALGFIHSGKALSFVYDIADLYKAELTIPVAFEATAAGEHELESRVRRALRDACFERQLLRRIVRDLFDVLGLDADEAESPSRDAFDEAVGSLWDPEGDIAGGRNWAGAEGDS
jgi:CRISPR-associated protein Cas1